MSDAGDSLLGEGQERRTGAGERSVITEKVQSPPVATEVASKKEREGLYPGSAGYSEAPELGPNFPPPFCTQKEASMRWGGPD